MRPWQDARIAYTVQITRSEVASIILSISMSLGLEVDGEHEKSLLPNSKSLVHLYITTIVELQERSAFFHYKMSGCEVHGAYAQCARQCRLVSSTHL